MIAEEIERFAADQPLANVVNLPRAANERRLLLAIDAGTGSCRAVLVAPDGAQIAIAQREYVHAAFPGVRGLAGLRHRANWGLICDCIREALAARRRAPRVKAVSATSMREGMVLYDARGREIWACPNVDSRARQEASELVRSGRRAGDLRALGGDWVSITAPARFRWMARTSPRRSPAIAHVGMLGDWILTRLCGEFVDRPVARLELGDVRSRHRGLVGADHRDRRPRAARLPTVVEPGDGRRQRDRRGRRRDTGLRQGTPCVVGGADTQLAPARDRRRRPGPFTVVGGTFWQHTVVLDEPLIDPDGRLRTLCHTVPSAG